MRGAIEKTNIRDIFLVARFILLSDLRPAGYALSQQVLDLRPAGYALSQQLTLELFLE
jgi:hypothetical protein